jgi:hypothetical protein
MSEARLVDTDQKDAKQEARATEKADAKQLDEPRPGTKWLDGFGCVFWAAEKKKRKRAQQERDAEAKQRDAEEKKQRDAVEKERVRQRRVLSERMPLTHAHFWGGDSAMGGVAMGAAAERVGFRGG